MYLMTDYEIYDPLYPSVYVLASFWACLATWLIYSLLVYGLFTCDAFQLWMNFKIILWFILVDYIKHLYLSLLMIQFLFGSWVYSLFVTKFITKKTFQETLKPSLLYWVLFEIVLACFLIALETISSTNIFGAIAEERIWRHIFPGILIFF